MKATIDRAGRLVLPKAARAAARLLPGTELQVRVEGGRIELEPAPLRVRLERRGRLVVAVPVGKPGLLLASEVDGVIRDLRESRRSGHGS